MGRIAYLGKSRAQTEALPRKVRESVEWAFDQLELSPDILPIDPKRGIHSKPLDGPAGLFRIAVSTSASDPGYRVICYKAEEGTVLVLRAVRRDAATYVGLRRILRLVREQRLDR